MIERTARPGKAVPEIVARWTPRHVWTLHVIPGLLEGPLLAVKRRVLSDDGGLAGDAILKFEIGRYNAGVWAGDLCSVETGGQARAMGSGELTDEAGEYLDACELAPWVYDHLPSEEEARAWLRRHRAEEQILRADPALRVFVCLPGDRVGAPDRAVSCAAKRDTMRVVNGDRFAWSVHLPGYTEPLPGQFIKNTLSGMHLLELASKPFLVSHWEGRDVRVYLNKPSAEQLAEAGAERAKKEAAKARAEHEADGAFWGAWHRGEVPGAQGPTKPSGVQALKALGLDATATASDVRAAFRRIAKEGHPDKGGAMDMGKLVELRDQALAYVAARS